jgi:hypothetical protein
MPWERRNQRGRYYTRSIWENGRCRRVYVGTGSLAELAAAEDDQRRAERMAERAAWQADLARLEAVDVSLQEVEGVINLLFCVVLTATGHRRHARGEWRRMKP